MQSSEQPQRNPADRLARVAWFALDHTDAGDLTPTCRRLLGIAAAGGELKPEARITVARIAADMLEDDATPYLRIER